jgi:hypothetical protein
MLALVVVATLARLILIYYNWPITNSDEGNMGLLAMHVAFRGEHPIFFYGLPYMGPLEGYIAAPLFHLFGVSLFSLRLGLLLLFPFFLIAMYYLTRLLYTKKLALFVVLLLSFGSSELLGRQLKAVGEYPETELFAALICLLAAWFALSYQSYSQDETARARLRRILAYGFLGLIVGLALWDDFLILPFVGTAGLLLALFCRRELRSWAGLSLLLGIIIGIFPLIVYNVTAPLDRNSVNVLIDITRSGTQLMVAQHIPRIRELIGALLIALPAATGYNPLCPAEVFPLFGPPTAATAQCIALQGAWSAGFIALGVTATIPAVLLVWRYWRHRTRDEQSYEERQDLIRQCARLMLLISAGGTLVLYATSPSAALYPGPTARYLTCLLIALPAVLWPLWRGRLCHSEPEPVILLGHIILSAAKDLMPGRRSFAAAQDDMARQDDMAGAQNDMGGAQNDRQAALRMTDAGLQRGSSGFFVFKVAALALILAVFVMGTISTFASIPQAEQAYNQEGALIQDLLHIGATRIYSEYWTCNRLTFHSQERIICSSLSEDLAPGFDRYAPYGAIVRSSPHPVYVFSAGSPQAASMERAVSSQHIHYRRYLFYGYIVYQTARPVRTPLQ